MNLCSCLRRAGMHHCADVFLFIRNRACAVCAYSDCKHTAGLPLRFAGGGSADLSDKFILLYYNRDI